MHSNDKGKKKPASSLKPVFNLITLHNRASAAVESLRGVHCCGETVCKKIFIVDFHIFKISLHKSNIKLFICQIPQLY